MDLSKLAPVCRPEFLSRENYYSNTYRCTFILGGVKRDWDVTHISVPFLPEKEERLIQQFGLPRSALVSYYECFGKRLAQEMRLLKTIHDRGNENLSGNFVKPVYVDTVKKEIRGSDLYIVTEPMNPLIGSEFIQPYAISLLNLLQLGARFAQMLKLMLGSGIHVGAFDLDTVYLTTDNTGRKMIKLGSLLYGSSDQGDDLPMLRTTPLNAAEDIIRGERQTTISDIQAVSRLLWTLSNGNHYRMSPQLSHSPQYAPRDLVDVLAKGMEASQPQEDMLKEFHNGLFRIIRDIKKGEMSNTMIPIEEVTEQSMPSDNGADRREDTQEVNHQNIYAQETESVQMPETAPENPELPPDSEKQQEEFSLEEIKELLMEPEEPQRTPHKEKEKKSLFTMVILPITLIGAGCAAVYLALLLLLQ